MLPCIISSPPGIRTPLIYHVDAVNNKIYMQYLEHKITLKDFLVPLIAKSLYADNIIMYSVAVETSFTLFLFQQVNLTFVLLIQTS